MKRILIPVDGSPESLEAVRSAVAGGPSVVARVELLNIQPRLHRHISQWLPKNERDAWRRERAREALAPARKIVEDAGITCGLRMGVGPVDKVVADTAKQLGIDTVEGFRPPPAYKRFALPAGIGVGVALLVLADA